MCISMFGHVGCMDGKAAANQYTFSPNGVRYWRRHLSNHAPPDMVALSVGHQTYNV